MKAFEIKNFWRPNPLIHDQGKRLIQTVSSLTLMNVVQQNLSRTPHDLRSISTCSETSPPATRDKGPISSEDPKTMRVIKVSSFLRAGSQFLDVMEELFSKSSLRSYFAEFVSTFIFVFAGVGSSISAGMPAATTAGPIGENCHILVVAVAHAFALFAAVFTSAHVSGGHVNPAVTVGLMMGGHVSILSGVCFCLAQLLGSIIACVLLMLLTAGQAIPTGGLAPHVTGMGGAATEFIGTFALVYTVCAARDPRKGPHGIAGPIAIGLVYGANFMLTGPFTGGFMNPARSFGPAVVTGDFSHHWVHWVGPILGGGVAGLVYESFMSQGGVDNHAGEEADDVV